LHAGGSLPARRRLAGPRQRARSPRRASSVSRRSRACLLTLLPLSFARKVARPAAWAAGVAGLGFVVYQGIVLGTFCPFCLVADLCGLGAAAAAFAWPPPLLYRGRGKKKPPAIESIPARLRWALAAQALVALPLLWPAPPKKPAWVELPAEATASIDVAAEFAPYLAERKGPPADVRPEPRVEPPPAPRPADDVPAPDSPPAYPDIVADAVPMPTPTPRPAPVRADPPPRPAPVRAEPPTAVIAPPRPAAREIVVLEYLNAFCSHCRATHARLDRVVAGFDRPVRRHRVYCPVVARGAALGEGLCRRRLQQGPRGRDVRRAPRDRPPDDRSICRRRRARRRRPLSGLDAPGRVDRLERDRRRFGAPRGPAHVRRRPSCLMGEQSEGASGGVAAGSWTRFRAARHAARTPRAPSRAPWDGEASAAAGPRGPGSGDRRPALLCRCTIAAVFAAAPELRASPIAASPRRAGGASVIASCGRSRRGCCVVRVPPRRGRGPEHVFFPAAGPLLVVANHQHALVDSLALPSRCVAAPGGARWRRRRCSACR
jgi:hypothetical protein